jgi:hypothetical protein
MPGEFLRALNVVEPVCSRTSSWASSRASSRASHVMTRQESLRIAVTRVEGSGRPPKKETWAQDKNFAIGEATNEASMYSR